MSSTISTQNDGNTISYMTYEFEYANSEQRYKYRENSVEECKNILMCLEQNSRLPGGSVLTKEQIWLFQLRNGFI